MSTITKVIRVGSSRGMVLGSNICKALELELGDRLKIDIVGNKVIIEKLEDFHTQIEDYCANSEGESDWTWE